MVDNLFSANGPEAAAPAKNYAAVTPSDTVNFDRVARALFIGTGGDVVVVPETGSAATFKNVADGSFLPLRCIRVNSTNTTASDIVWMD